jgi:hypothetical protein
MTVLNGMFISGASVQVSKRLDWGDEMEQVARYINRPEEHQAKGRLSVILKNCDAIDEWP